MLTIITDISFNVCHYLIFSRVTLELVTFGSLISTHFRLMNDFLHYQPIGYFYKFLFAFNCFYFEFKNFTDAVQIEIQFVH